MAKKWWLLGSKELHEYTGILAGPASIFEQLTEIGTADWPFFSMMKR